MSDLRFLASARRKRKGGAPIKAPARVDGSPSCARFQRQSDRIDLLIPLTPSDAVDMANWIFSHCSTPLISDAQRALRTDENLWFGRLRIDREVIESDAFRIEWKRVACVRLQPGRVLLVREQWLPLARVIRLDQVPPHPSVFVAVVRTCARRVEVDDPTAFLT